MYNSYKIASSLARKMTFGSHLSRNVLLDVVEGFIEFIEIVILSCIWKSTELISKSMIAHSYPIPRLWLNIRRCAGKKWYVALDVNAGFWSVPVKEGSRHLSRRLVAVNLLRLTRD